MLKLGVIAGDTGTVEQNFVAGLKGYDVELVCGAGRTPAYLEWFCIGSRYILQYKVRL